jgi:hypothetical protein
MSVKRFSCSVTGCVVIGLRIYDAKNIKMRVY